MTRQGVVIVGAGPAGLAPLFAAAGAGRLDEVLRLGVTILEERSVVGDGMLGTYGIHSDSSALALTDIVQRTKEPRLLALRDHPVTRELVAYGHASAPLKLVGKFLAIAGNALCACVQQSPRGQVLRGVRALLVRQAPDGGWLIHYGHLASGLESHVEAHTVITALGAEQPVKRLYTELVAGSPLLPALEGKVLQSAAVLSEGGVQEVLQRLRQKVSPKVVIVGGSASAGAVAVHLLNRANGLAFDTAGITLLHRRPLRITYESSAHALAEGYDEFSEEDVCPITGIVFRRSGFRLDSRELMMRVRGIGGRQGEDRVELLRLSAASNKLAQERLQQADLVVAALGYRPRTLPFFDMDVRPISLHMPVERQWSIVDRNCCLLTRGGTPLAGAFSIGLAVGPSFSPDLGGEKDFQGQVNSLWMWQHTLGLRIVDGVVARVAALEHSYPTTAQAQSSSGEMNLVLSLEGVA